ncbi:MAG: metallophosphoesterase [Actinobacteria bacterium]|nr:metallophosphoesterase [Actinomycetota bacterium]
MKGYDVIGDIHGCATKLEALLGKLGYRPDHVTGAYSHPERAVVFVGDLIDRGDEQLRVLEIAKPMADAGTALLVMGNHEFNAVAYATEWPSGSGNHLRPRNAKNDAQHCAFLKQVTPPAREFYIGWFRSLPLWLDLGGLRVVHACWHRKSMDVVEAALDGNRFSTDDELVRASTKDDPLHAAVETLLKGPEISLSDHGQPSYRDKDGHPRAYARIRWWAENATTLSEVALLDGKLTTAEGQPYPDLPDVPVGADSRAYIYDGDVPVLFGHYWRSGAPEHLEDWTARTGCQDFSAVKGGDLTAYRWSGETELREENFVQQA